MQGAQVERLDRRGGGPVVPEPDEPVASSDRFSATDLEAMVNAAAVVTALSELLAGEAEGSSADRRRYAEELCACAEQLRSCAGRCGDPDGGLLRLGGVDHAAQLSRWCLIRA